MRTGHADSAKGPIASLAKALEAAVSLPAGTLDVIGTFANVRNRIAHGHQANETDVLRAVDAGVTILRTLGSVPLETYVVADTHVALYEDEALTLPLDVGHGVMLEILSPGGVSKTRRVFPTTKSHFAIGQQVAWEWNTQLRFGLAYYRDPQSGAANKDWDSSLEFIGRTIESK